jgi:membrane-associated phospholipid phosphatase
VVKVKKRNNTFIKKSILPASLIGIGLFINFSSGSLGKENLQENIQDGLNFDSNLENIFLITPAIELYAANIFKVPSKNTVIDQTKNLLIANLVTFGVSELLKQSTNELRPDGSDYLSFPSGHTANAFVMATVLHHEYIDSSPWLAYSGYAFSTATAVFRVLNNKHYVSDVMVGAGIGIAITELTYAFKPLQNWHPFQNEKRQVFIAPTYMNDAFGLMGVISFK